MTPIASVLIAAALTGPQAPPAPGRWLVYIGTYTAPGKSRGIYVASFDDESGRLGPLHLAAETENPSFLALHPSRPLLYAVNEVGDFAGERSGSVAAFAIDATTGQLRLLNRVSSGGADPCHLAVDRSGRSVLVANYTGGSVVTLPLRADGGLQQAATHVQHTGASVDPKRQTGPHAHMIETDPANHFALAADLGLDQILVYPFDAASGKLDAQAVAPVAIERGSGPRHFAFSPDGRDLYLLNEMSLTVKAFHYASGRLAEVQTVSSLPSASKPGPDDSGAEILVHPSGRFVYASNRGPDTIAAFARDAATGRLELIGHVPSGGHTPRGFAIDPGGHVLLAANQRSDNVVVFRIDPRTGTLSATGQVLEIGSPVALTFFRIPSSR